MGDTTKVVVVVVGVVTLHFDGDKELVLHDCLYVPRVRRNLISVPSLGCNGYSTFLIKVMFLLNRMTVLSVMVY